MGYKETRTVGMGVGMEVEIPPLAKMMSRTRMIVLKLTLILRLHLTCPCARIHGVFPGQTLLKLGMTTRKRQKCRPPRRTSRPQSQVRPRCQSLLLGMGRFPYPLPLLPRAHRHPLRLLENLLLNQLLPRNRPLIIMERPVNCGRS